MNNDQLSIRGQGNGTTEEGDKKKDTLAKHRNVPFCRDGGIRTHDLAILNNGESTSNLRFGDSLIFC